MPEILGVSETKGPAQKYELYELKVDLNAEYENPFDREEVLLTAEFVSPSGQTYTSQGFWYEKYEYVNELPVNTYPFWDQPECEYQSSDWRIRFLPKEAGTWSYTVQLMDQTGTASGGPYQFECATGSGKGGVSLAANGMALEYDDGTRYTPLGFNIPWYSLSTYDYYSKYAAEKANCVRVVGMYRHCALENNFKGPNPGDECLDTALGDYRGWGLMQMWRLDYILDRLHERGMKALYSIYSHRALFDTGTGKYLSANGGPCDTRQDYWGTATDVNLQTNKWDTGTYEVWIGKNLEASSNEISNLLQADAGNERGPLIIHTTDTAEGCTLVVQVYKGESDDHLQIDVDGEQVLYQQVGTERSVEVSVPLGSGAHTIAISDAGPDNNQKWNNIQLNYVRLLNYKEVPAGSKDAVYWQERALEYLTARFGWHPGLMGWELWNELDSTLAPWQLFEFERASNWASGQLAFIKEHDAQERPTSVSLVDRDEPVELYAAESVDIVQTRMYATSGRPERWNWWENDNQAKEYGKISITGEDGLTYDDRSLQSYRNLIWGNALQCSASLHFIQQNVEKLRLDKIYGAARGLLADLPGDAIFAIEGEALAQGRPIRDLVIRPWRRLKDSERPTVEHVVGRDGSVSDERWVNRTVSGTKWTSARQNVFHTDWLEAGEFEFTVASASSAWVNNYVVVEIDGVEVWRQAIVKNEHVGETFSIPVPQGEHTIRIAGDGNDCAEVDISAFGFTGYQRQTKGTLIGVRNATEQWVWVHNPENELDTYTSGEEPYPVPESWIELEANTPGEHVVSWFNTETGRLMRRAGVKAQEGRVRVQSPGVKHDVLMVVRAQEYAAWLDSRLGEYTTEAVSSTEVRVRSKDDARKEIVLCPVDAAEALSVERALQLELDELAVVSVYETESLTVKRRELLAGGAVSWQVAPGEVVVIEVFSKGGIQPPMQARTASGGRVRAASLG